MQQGVPCRIQIARTTAGNRVLVAGRLEQAHIPDLLRACSGSAESVVLDLADLQSADRIAVDALRRLRHDGVTLIGLPKYLRFQLDDVE